jgi:hypothetical protein
MMIIGTCNICAGAVVSKTCNTPAHCQDCGAVLATPHGPLLPMRRPVASRGRVNLTGSNPPVNETVHTKLDTAELVRRCRMNGFTDEQIRWAFPGIGDF